MELVRVKNLLGFDCGSLVAFQLNKNSKLDSLNFQSNAMKNTYSKFPSVLLFCRTHNSTGKALYTFFVDSADVQLEEEIHRVVHFAVPKNECADGLTHMYETFKEFNPDWPKMKTVLVDPLFTGNATLAEAFPSVEIVLSVFHICKFFQQKIFQMSLKIQVERWLLGVLKDTMCLATKTNLENMYDTFKKFVSPELFPQLNGHWLLTDRIWDKHCWRSVSESTQYFQSLEILTQAFYKIFSSAVTLESSITSLAKYIQECKLNMNSSDPFDTSAVHCVPDDPAPCSSSSSSNGPIDDELNLSNPPPKISIWYAKKKLPPKEDEQSVGMANPEEEDTVQCSLQNVCTVPAAKLCLKELAVAQKSMSMVGASDSTVSVRIVEDSHVVSRMGSSPFLCTCHFSTTFQLPCRHILAVLREEKRILQQDMVSVQWQKYYSEPSDNNPLEGDMLEVLQSSWLASDEKSFTVQFLTDELMRLLAECSNNEFECRYNTLRDLADSWIGPYEQVKL